MSNASHEGQRIPTVLVASMHDLRHFGNLLRGVNFVDFATMMITSGGLTVFVEESSLVSAASYIPAQIFDEFTYSPPMRPRSASPTPPEPSQTEEATVLEFPLHTFIDSLSIFSTGSAPSVSVSEGRTQNRRWVRDRERGGDDDVPRGRIEAYFGASAGKTVGMRLSYAGEGHPLSLLIAEGSADPDAKFEVTTYTVETQPDMSFDIEQTVLQLILKSSWLHDALAEIDSTCEKITLIGSPPEQSEPARRPRVKTAAPVFRIHAEGAFGNTEMDYPNDREVLETVHCAEPVSFSYRVGHIARAQRALQNSSKTSLRIGVDGTMNMQFLVSSPSARGGASEAFISFRFLPLDLDEAE